MVAVSKELYAVVELADMVDNDYVGKLCSSGRWFGKEAKGAHQVLDKYLNILRLK